MTTLLYIGPEGCEIFKWISEISLNRSEPHDDGDDYACSDHAIMNPMGIGGPTGTNRFILHRSDFGCPESRINGLVPFWRARIISAPWFLWFILDVQGLMEVNTVENRVS